MTPGLPHSRRAEVVLITDLSQLLSEMNFHLHFQLLSPVQQLTYKNANSQQVCLTGSVLQVSVSYCEPEKL